MPTLIDVAALNQQVLWAGFVLALGFGGVAQYSHFCTMGAVSDVVHLGDWRRARMWALAAAVAAIGFGLMAGLGWIDASRSLYTAPRWLWLSNVFGGVLFGIGMVLASGCGNKTLVRIGGGSLKSLVVFVVMAVAALATLRGITAVLRVATVDSVVLQLAVGQDLPALLSGSAGPARRAWALWLGPGLGAAVVAWVLARRDGREAEVLVGGIGIGLLVAGLWWVSGHLGFVAEHPETLEAVYLGSTTKGPESFSFVAPMAATLDWLMMFSDASKVLTLGVVTPVGVVAGSALVAVLGGRFRWEGFGSAEDTGNHLVGAVLMGVGGITALGCTVGHGLSGISTLAVGSVVATAAMIGGAVLALHYQAWRVGRQA